MNIQRFIHILSLILGIMLAQASADTYASSAWQALKNGEAVAIMRHALAPGTGDPAELSLDDCTTQRNLSDVGKSQAVSIGERFKREGINSASVISSAWCRCYQTAERLDLGDVTIEPILNSFFRDRSTAELQTIQLKAMIERWIEDKASSKVLVTHQVNITALTGSWVDSGETLIVGLNDQDEVLILERIETN